MAHRRGTFRGRGGVSQSQRRKKMWVNVNPNATDDIAGGELDIPAGVAPGNTFTSVFLPSTLNESFRESTILRIRGWLDLEKSTITDPPVTVFAFGICMVSDEAAGLGSTGSVPNPATISGQDWDGWMFLRSSTQAPVDITGTILDVKAMRKWQSGQSVLFGFGRASDAATPTAGVCKFNVRMLLLLP